MERMESLTEAMESFMKQLPDPGKVQNISTISAWIEVNGQKNKLQAQKVKSSLGIRWEVHHETDVS